MKIRVVSTLAWTLLGAVLVSSCGISQEQLDQQATEIVSNIFATQTAAAPTSTLTPTSTPTTTATPTDTPTITPTPGPDLSQAVLTLDDLPEDFEDASEEFNAIAPGFEMDAFPYQYLESFVFMDDCQCEFIVGITFHLPWRSQQKEFDQFSAGFARIMIDSAELLGGESEVRRSEDLVGLEDIGDAVTGVTTTVGSNGGQTRMDIVVFRRGIVGAWIFVYYPEGEIPVVSIDELARKLDARIVDVIGSPSLPPEAKKSTRFEDNLDNDLALGPVNMTMENQQWPDENQL